MLISGYSAEWLRDEGSAEGRKQNRQRQMGRKQREAHLPSAKTKESGPLQEWPALQNLRAGAWS
jgi:hypothetical protein